MVAKTGKQKQPKKQIAKRGPRKLAEPRAHEEVYIENHKQLLVMAKKLRERLGADPDFSVMLLSNPILALRKYGVRMTPEMEHHVLSTLRHPPKLRSRREELEEKLTKELGVPPKPDDPKWLAELVFKTRKRTPRSISKLEPAYKPALNAATIASLRSRAPKATKRYPGKRRIKVRHSMGVVKGKQALRRLDLDAELPELKPLQRAPASLTIEKAWFYKDDPVVRDAVELGVIMRRGFPFRNPAQFRDLAAGKRTDAFHKFVRKITIKDSKKSDSGKTAPARKKVKRT